METNKKKEEKSSKTIFQNKENLSKTSTKNANRFSKTNTNLEIYNYLNLVDRRLGKLYKHSGFSPLPNNFFVDNAALENALVLGEMKRENFEDFGVAEKRIFRKMLKISLKNCKKMQKSQQFLNFEENLQKLSAKNMGKNSIDFLQLKTYLLMRQEVTQLILKDMKNHDFDETAAYAELFNLNPILGEILQNIFSADFDCNILENLPHAYASIFNKNLAMIEKNKALAEKHKKKSLEEKQNSKNKKSTLEQMKNLEQLRLLEKNNAQKNLQKNTKTAKISEKSAKKVEKTAILAKKFQNKQDAKAIRKNLNKSNLNKSK